MRAVRLAVFALLALPGVARAGDVALVQRDLPLEGDRRPALAAATPRFNMVGLHWQGPGRVLFRAHGLHGRWGPWVEADADTGPDAASSERRATRAWQDGNVVWAGGSDGFRYRTVGQVRRLRAYFLWSRVGTTPARRPSLAGTPPIVSRAGWRADEDIRRGNPRYAAAVRFAVVHHTAGSNAYSAAQSAAIVRGIEAYHVQANGWDDIGYNLLVDRYGQVFEGRYGGLERPVIGAHAEGFNTGSVGIALIGTYGSTLPTAAQRAALVRVLAWRLDVAHVDPLTVLAVRSGGNAKFRSGTQVTLRAVSGHRDTGFTACPGAAAYLQLPSIARAAALTGLPKLYEPLVTGKIGGRVRFTARLSAPRPWTVRITDAAGGPVASGAGTGAAVDWTWEATRAAKSSYRWWIESAGARSATGTLGGAVSGPVLVGLVADPPLVLPNTLGSTGTTTISFSLGVEARVIAVVSDAGGVPVSTLLDGRRRAGPQSLAWVAGVFPDGRYTVKVTARAGGRPLEAASVEVVVDRLLTGFALAPSTISPNGDDIADVTTFAFGLTAATTVRIELVRGAAVVATVLPPSPYDPGPHVLDWDGRVEGVPVADGQYLAVLTVTGAAGDVSVSAPLVVDATAPVLRALDAPKLRFWLSEPATVTLVVNGKRLVKVEPQGTFAVPRPRDPVRSVSAVAADAAGNVSATLIWP